MGPINRGEGGSRCSLSTLPLTFCLLGGQHSDCDRDVSHALWLVWAGHCQLEFVDAFLKSPQLHLVRIIPLYTVVAISLGTPDALELPQALPAIQPAWESRGIWY